MSTRASMLPEKIREDWMTEYAKGVRTVDGDKENE